MLQRSAIDTPTWELLKILSSYRTFKETRLVGGTALALQLGHRKSVDLDFFGKVNFDEIDKIELFKSFANVNMLKVSRNINIFSINGIKVDFVNYGYPWLEKSIIVEKIRLAGLKDIAAMKLAAITGRGSKKDFVDIYFLLQQFSLKELFGFYNRKYFDGSEYLALKSMTYFEDAEKEIMPKMLQEINWEKIKERILSEVQHYR